MATKYQPSIIQTKCECFICHKSPSAGLEHHHCLHGTGQRKLCDQDSLWIWLCRNCHSRLHDFNEHDKELQKLAQDTLIKQYMKQGYPEDVARDLFLKRYGRFYDN